MFRYQSRLFVTIGWEVISLYYITKVFWQSTLIMKFPTIGFLGTFSMSFYIIFWTYSEKNHLVTNLLNVQPNGPGLYYAFNDG